MIEEYSSSCMYCKGRLDEDEVNFHFDCAKQIDEYLQSNDISIEHIIEISDTIRFTFICRLCNNVVCYDWFIFQIHLSICERIHGVTRT
jgi:hypothetical protein